MDFIRQEREDFRNLFKRVKRRDFSGTGGQIIKNSSYQLTTNIVSKVGALIFTAIIARLLLPDLFGLYSLALGTIVFFAAFTDMGLDSAMVAFLSKLLGKNKEKKAKSYFNYLSNIKIILILLVSLILLLSAYFIANNYYNKPIFFALIAGGLYIPLSTFSRFIETLYLANNNFKFPMFKEIIFQLVRFLIIPLVIFLLFKTTISGEKVIAILILGLSFSYFISLIYLWTKAKKTMPFLKLKEKRLLKNEKEKIKKFTLPLAAIVLSGVFFGYIDMLMLGHFVTGEFVGYYGATFSLIGSATVILSFMATALFPIFVRTSGKKLNLLFKRMATISTTISLLAVIFTFFAAKYIIIIIYGSEYLQAIIFLKYFSVLLLVGTLIGLHSTYFVSQEKTRKYSYLLITTTFLNIILNYLLITNGLKIGMQEAVLGACTATIISRFVFLGLLAFFRKR
ncbi:oligosaccharide flippase family protein [Candidatus Pacearchaeota archaeon]|nr:oligosaccharide flippase family protein [Candidatus Pacearchaeota archaeon]